VPQFARVLRRRAGDARRDQRREPGIARPPPELGAEDVDQRLGVLVAREARRVLEARIAQHIGKTHRLDQPPEEGGLETGDLNPSPICTLVQPEGRHRSQRILGRHR
jgi:hypothetical protein